MRVVRARTLKLASRAIGVAMTMSSVLAANSGAVEPTKLGVFVYSNLCWSQQSGDAAGLRITIVRYADPSRDHVLFEWSEGPLYERTGYKVRIDPAMSRISFEVDQDATMTMPDWQTYTGEFSADALTLRSSSNPARTYRLPRVQNFSQEDRRCP
jgi:hypothetical protein